MLRDVKNMVKMYAVSIICIIFAMIYEFVIINLNVEWQMNA